MGQISSRSGSNETNESSNRGQPTSSASVLDLITSSRAGDFSNTSGVVQQAAGDWQDQLVRQTRIVQQLANITYDEFLANVKQLNEISSHYLDDNGKQLVNIIL